MSEVGQRIWQNRLDAKIADYENAAKEYGEASETFLAATLGDESDMSILCHRLASAAYLRSETPEKALPHLEATLAYTLVRNGEDDPTVSRLRERIAEIKGNS